MITYKKCSLLEIIAKRLELRFQSRLVIFAPPEMIIHRPTAGDRAPITEAGTVTILTVPARCQASFAECDSSSGRVDPEVIR